MVTSRHPHVMNKKDTVGFQSQLLNLQVGNNKNQQSDRLQRHERTLMASLSFSPTTEAEVEPFALLGSCQVASL